jgi:hypothetical protein
VSKRVDKLAGQFLTRMLADAGVTKSAGSTAQYMPYAVGLAEAVVSVEKELKLAVRAMGRHAAEVGRLVDANGERINQLADRYAEYAGTAVPSAEKVHRGVVDMDLERFRLGLIDQQAQAPKTANGHGGHGQGVSPFPAPEWHPESDGGV